MSISKQERQEKELTRLEMLTRFDEQYYNKGYSLICGIDEAGRGPLAGPVAAGAVILPRGCKILYVNDSKKLSEKRREELSERIKEEAIAFSVAMVDNRRIDEINILQATYEAMRKAVESLKVKPDFLLVDGMAFPGSPVSMEPVVKGDALSFSVAAASILAKVARDRLMRDYDVAYPEYGYAKHKGYGTAAHMEAIRKYGPSPIHRKSFITRI